ncbi:CpeT/CpcT family (DUF1001) [Cyclonatronum proteinivorum]|uniref:CpeT/CpcT family (DUF1001) n=1 Tax=Cyclonatronum proteinivorum TaxID=1457365 RepID=A0A345UFR4_9BACT|nr:chromophore lyase CpcT/CpeT [Cyclonatronum proteinivorum]AXI99315.1 CpeT/CpcT family (DUF1001) [Cyclonatronum proteinivorum]
MRKFLPLCLTVTAFVALSFSSSCVSETDPPEDTALETLFTLMQGTFSSEAQSDADPAFFPIILHMEPVWTERGRWLYVEQAVAGRETDPYRQRVYHVFRDETGQLVSDVFTLINEQDFVGAQFNPAVFDDFDADILEYRSGCAVFLEQTGPAEFTGGTYEDQCPSSLQGATFATSEVLISEEGMVTWDRGFDAEGQQVWGSESGGYIFLRAD